MPRGLKMACVVAATGLADPFEHELKTRTSVLHPGQRMPSPRRAPSRATERASPCSIAKTVCGRPSSSHGCTRTTIVQGSGNVTGLAGVTTPHDPRWTGWNRDTYVPAKSATICSSLMPGRIGVRVNNPN